MLLSMITFSTEKKCTDLSFSYNHSRITAKQGKYNAMFNYSKCTASTVECSADVVTVYSRSITTRSSPRSNEPALTSSRQRGDPVYSRTLVVVAAFSSTLFNGRSRRRPVVETTVVISDCPRHTA